MMYRAPPLMQINPLTRFAAHLQQKKINRNPSHCSFRNGIRQIQHSLINRTFLLYFLHDCISVFFCSLHNTYHRVPPLA